MIKGREFVSTMHHFLLQLSPKNNSADLKVSPAQAEPYEGIFKTGKIFKS